MDAVASVLSAIGTISLAAIAYLQLRTLRQERDRERQYELVDALYVPLLQELEAILDPKQTFKDVRFDPNRGRSSASFHAWPRLKEEALHLASRVPDDLRDLLDETEALYSDLKPRLKDLQATSYEIECALGEEYLGSGGGDSKGSVDFPVYDHDGTRLSRVRIWELWTRDISLEDRAQELSEEYLNDGYEIELHIDGEPAGSAEDATRVALEGVNRLEDADSARETREGPDVCGS